MKKLLFLFLFALTTSPVFAQNPPAPLDGPNRIFHDDLLDNLQGRWKVTGIIQGKPSEMEVNAEWTLNHQFMLMREREIGAAEGTQPYDVMAYIGYDNVSERYVVHWIDIFGGRFSETLGYGTRSGNAIRFNFEYPDGPFHNTFIWNAESRTWHFLMERKNAEGKWTQFADQTARRVADSK